MVCLLALIHILHEYIRNVMVSRNMDHIDPKEYASVRQSLYAYHTIRKKQKTIQILTCIYTFACRPKPQGGDFSIMGTVRCHH